MNGATLMRVQEKFWTGGIPLVKEIIINACRHTYPSFIVSGFIFFKGVYHIVGRFQEAICFIGVFDPWGRIDLAGELAVEIVGRL